MSDISKQYSKIKQYEKVPLGFTLDAVQGVAVYDEESGITRMADAIEGSASLTGRTVWPLLVEEGWFRSYRVDQLPLPEDMGDSERFAVFPVNETGVNNSNLSMYRVAEYKEWCDAWRKWRAAADPSVISPTHTVLSRLARNATRRIPDRNQYEWYAICEVLDMVRYEDAKVISNGYYNVVICKERDIIARYQLGSDLHEGCKVWRICSGIHNIQNRSDYIHCATDPNTFNWYLSVALNVETNQYAIYTVLRRDIEDGDFLCKMYDSTELLFNTGSPWISPDGDWPSDDWWWTIDKYTI